MAQQGRKIAIVGGSGNIGSITLNSLVSKGIHTITAITRTDSTATFPTGIIVKKGAYNDENFLFAALQGQDVLLIQVGSFALEIQADLIRAAAKAGVKYILPTEFGSDPDAEPMYSVFPPLFEKRQRRQLIEELGTSSWIAVVNNPWFDWSLGQGFWGIDIKARTATLWDGGNTKVNTTTLQRTADGTAALLSLPEEDLAKYKNKPFYLSSFFITQREMLESVQRATGTTDADWTLETKDYADVARESDEQLKQGNFSALVTKFYSANLHQGYGGDYNHKVEDAGRLGLANEELDEVVKQVVAKVEKS